MVIEYYDARETGVDPMLNHSSLVCQSLQCPRDLTAMFSCHYVRSILCKLVNMCYILFADDFGGVIKIVDTRLRTRRVFDATVFWNRIAWTIYGFRKVTLILENWL